MADHRLSEADGDTILSMDYRIQQAKIKNER
jgi:hypothetical protein